VTTIVKSAVAAFFAAAQDFLSVKRRWSRVVLLVNQPADTVFLVRKEHEVIVELSWHLHLGKEGQLVASLLIKDLVHLLALLLPVNHFRLDEEQW